jgi:hypothetical protein
MSRGAMNAAFGVVLAVVVLACSPANVGGPADAAHDAPDGLDSDIISTCGDIGSAYCSFLMSCSQSIYEFRYGATTNLAGTCLLGRTQACEGNLKAPQTGATQASVNACASDLNPTAWPCVDFLEGVDPPPDCKPLGPRREGAPCAVNAQCMTGYCRYPTGKNCGTCAALSSTSCAESGCPTGARCLANQCAFFAAMGQSCGDDQTCEDGLSCVNSQCIPSTKEAGAPCSLSGAGGIPDCDLTTGLACNVMTAKCVSAAFAGPGKACGIVEGIETTCSRGLCIAGVCVADILPGGACDLLGPAQCMSDTFCIVSADGGTSGTCQVRGTSACH